MTMERFEIRVDHGAPREFVGREALLHAVVESATAAHVEIRFPSGNVMVAERDPSTPATDGMAALRRVLAALEPREQP